MASLSSLPCATRANDALETVVWASYAEAEPIVRPFLRARNRNPFLSFDWTAEYSRLLREPLGWRPLPMGFFRNGVLTAFAPLSVRSFPAGVDVVAFTGQGRGSYLGIAGEVAPDVLQAIRAHALSISRHAVLWLPDIPERDPLLNCAAGFHCTPMYPCLHRNLRPDAPPEPASRRRKHKAIAKQYQRLARLGDVQRLVLDFDRRRDEALSWWPRILSLHDARHGDRYNVWTNPTLREFLLSYLKNAQETGALCFVLLLNGEPVAFEFGILMERSFCALLTAFDPAYHRLEIGHLNRQLAIGACQDLGFDAYDFARGSSQAKLIWANGSIVEFELAGAAGRSLRARLAAYLLARRTSAAAWARAHGVSLSRAIVAVRKLAARLRGRKN
jgi:CelD/BcsL family acetyltransferase involved in cellulose biosynthesis